MKRTLAGGLEAGESLIKEAVEARRRLHEAEARPADEVERLRLLADSLYETVTDYQVRALDRQAFH